MITYRKLKDWLDTLTDEQLDKLAVVETNDYVFEQIASLRFVNEDIMDEMEEELDSSANSPHSLSIDDPILSIFEE